MAYEKKPFVDFVKFNHQRDEKDIIDEYNSYRDKYSECKHCKVCQERNYFKYNRKKDKIRFYVFKTTALYYIPFIIIN